MRGRRKSNEDFAAKIRGLEDARMWKVARPLVIMRAPAVPACHRASVRLRFARGCPTLRSFVHSRSPQATPPKLDFSPPFGHNLFPALTDYRY